MWKVLIGCLCLWRATHAPQVQIRQPQQVVLSLHEPPCYQKSYYYSMDFVPGVRVYQTRAREILPNGIEVLCDTESDGGGWIIFQRRFSGYLDFNVGWKTYESGFGSVDGEFWMGLKFIHNLTNEKCHELRVEVHTDIRKDFAVYSYFKLDGPSDHYKLHIGSIVRGNTDPTIMAQHDGRQFSTKDRDHDDAEYIHCGRDLQGGWWYAACAFTQLNSPWITRVQKNQSQIRFGIRWTNDKGDAILGKMKLTEMKIRPCD